MYDMTIRLRTDSDKCLYQQIYEHIRQEIREGKLLAGERLPSTRSLAEYLQVARSTVDYAYDQLLSEGYIEARPYKGYFVCRLEGIFAMEPREENEPEPDTSGEESVPEEGCIDFSPYGIDMNGFPVGVWKRITKNILNDNNSDLFAQGEPQGDYDLRLTISRYLHSSRGVNCRPEQIIVGAGNDYLLLLLEKILGRHVGIAMENPTYKRAYRIFESFAYRIHTVDMDDKGMRADRLSGLPVRVAYVMPSHQYPTGAVMTIGRRAELLRWAEREPDRYLIEDDHDSEYRYRGKPIPSLQSVDGLGKVIYLGTFSKSIAPSLRISYMVLPPELLKRYHKNCGFYSTTVPKIQQEVLRAFIEEGHFERHLNKMRGIYRSKHDFLLAELKKRNWVEKIYGDHAGLHVLVQVNTEKKEKEICNLAEKQGIRIYGISEYVVWESDQKCHETGKNKNASIESEKKGLAANSPHKPILLLGYGRLSEDEIQKGLFMLDSII